MAGDFLAYPLSVLSYWKGNGFMQVRILSLGGRFVGEHFWGGQRIYAIGYLYTLPYS
jgi:hypothetical protein